MKNLLLASSLVLFLVSCKDISGTLVVSETFGAKVAKRCSWFSPCDPNQKTEIPAGSYQSKVDFGSKTEIKIELQANAFKETIILKRPKNFEFPKNGPFQLTKEQVEQDFSVQGVVDTRVDESERYRDNESCTYMINDYGCWPTGNGQVSCGPQSRAVWGYRYVEYFNRNTTRQMYADIMDGAKSKARFSGIRTDTEKVYTFTSVCR